jgi:hypothetical protein
VTPPQGRHGRELYLYVQAILQQPGVRRKLKERADGMAVRAAAIAAAEGVQVRIVRQDGQRPKGRPYSRISVPASNEFGDSKTKRLRLLGRVVR